MSTPYINPQLTHELIKKELQNHIKNTHRIHTYSIQIQQLFNILTQMSQINIPKNNPHYSRDPYDRQIFDQLIQQCQCSQEVNGQSRVLCVQMEKFIYNVIRGEILVVEKLKDINKQLKEIQKLMNGQKSSYNSNRITNADGKVTAKQIAEQLFQLKEIKAEVQNNLYHLRLPFLGQKNTGRTIQISSDFKKSQNVKKLGQNTSNSLKNPLPNSIRPSYISPPKNAIIEQSQVQNISQLKQDTFHSKQPTPLQPPITCTNPTRQQNFYVPPYQHQQQNDSNPYKKLPITISKVQNTKRQLNLSSQVNLKIIFILTLVLSCLEFFIIIVFNHYMNVIVFSLIMTMYMVQYYNKLMIRFFLALVSWSIFVEIVWFFVEGQFFVRQNAYKGIIGVGIGTEAINLPGYFYFIFTLCVVIFIGKILLTFFLLMEIQINQIMLYLYKSKTFTCGRKQYYFQFFEK